MWRFRLCLLFILVLSISCIPLTKRIRKKKGSLNVVEEALHKFKIVPDVIPVAPKQQLNVGFITGAISKLGNINHVKGVQLRPRISWEAGDPSIFHTICMFDLDYPTPKNPCYRSWLHWLVVNMPGNRITLGETLTKYVAPKQTNASDFHRYVFFIFKQPSRITFKEPIIVDRFPERRRNFSAIAFAEKYNLGSPFAASFFRSN